jgi:hypothetical protein
MKTIHPCLLALLLLFIPAVSKTQTGRFYIGPKAGLGIPNLTGGPGSTPLSEGYTSRLGLYGGLTALMQTGNHLALRAEINYSSQGGKRDGMQALPLPQDIIQLWQSLPDVGVPIPDYLYADVKSRAVLDYIEIPVMAQYRLALGKKTGFYLQAGPYVSILLHAKYVTSGTSLIYLDKAATIKVDDLLAQVSYPTLGPQDFGHTEDVTSDIRRFNVGGEGAAGFSWHMNRGMFFLEGGGNYGFIQIQKDKANGSNHTGAGTVTLGYLLGLY